MQTINEILLGLQRQFDAVTKNADNPHFKSTYADFNAVLDAVKSPLNDQGILIEQIPDADQFGKFVKTTLLHVESGEEKSCKVYLELPKPDMQKMGSAITYAKRYGLQTLCVLPSEDDDGNAAAGLESKGATNAQTKRSGFSSQTTVRKKTTKKAAKRSTTAGNKNTTKLANESGGSSQGSSPGRGFSSRSVPKTATDKVTPPPAKTSGGFGGQGSVTPPPDFSNAKPSFSSRNSQPEPEF